MRLSTFVPLVIAALTAPLALVGCSSGTREASVEPALTQTAVTPPLIFAMPPNNDDPTTFYQFEAVADLIAEATGRQVKLQSSQSYPELLNSLAEGTTDIALTSQFATALAFEQGLVNPILVWDAGEHPIAVCLVSADSEIESLADFRDRRIAYVHADAAAGYLMPKAMLAQEGFTEGEDYSSTLSGTHDAAVLAVTRDEADMACTTPRLLGMFAEQGLIDPAEIRPVAQTAPIPISRSFVVSGELDQEVSDQLTAELPELIMSQEDLTSFYGGAENYIVDPEPAVYEPLLQIARQAGVGLDDIYR